MQPINSVIKKKTLIFLLIILLIGSFLRFYKVDEKGLWNDEDIRVEIATSDNLNSAISNQLNEVHGSVPFYPTFLYFWIKLFGLKNFMLRLPSIIFGVLSIFLIFKIGKTLLGNKVGLMSSFIFSINVLHVTFSQEAGEYSLLILLSLCSVFFFLRMVQKKDATSCVGYIFFSALMIYTHYFAWFLIIFQNIFIFLLRKKFKSFIKNWIFMQLLLLVFFIPWFILLITNDNPFNWFLLLITNDNPFNFNSVSLSWGRCSITDILYTFSSSGFLVKNRIYEMSFFKGFYNFFSEHSLMDLYFLGKPQFFLFIMLVILASFGAYCLIKSKNVNIRSKLFLLLWLLVPLILKLSIHPPHTCIIRYYLLSLPPFLIFVSNGVVSINKIFWRIIAILLIISASILVYNIYYNIYSEVAFTGPYWQIGQFIPANATKKEIAQYISFNSKPNLFPYIKIQKDAFKYINKNYPDAIVLTDWITAFKLSSSIHGWVKEPPLILSSSLNIAEINSNEFNLILKITGDGFDYRKGDLVEKALNKFNVSLIKQWEYYNMSVEIYKNNEK